MSVYVIWTTEAKAILRCYNTTMFYLQLQAKRWKKKRKKQEEEEENAGVIALFLSVLYCELILL